MEDGWILMGGERGQQRRKEEDTRTTTITIACITYLHYYFASAYTTEHSVTRELTLREGTESCRR